MKTLSKSLASSDFLLVSDVANSIKELKKGIIELFEIDKTSEEDTGIIDDMLSDVFGIEIVNYNRGQK